MIVAFYSILPKKITVTIDGVASIVTLQREKWTIIDKVVDLAQIIGYSKLLKDNVQIYAAKWSATPFFDVNTLITTINSNSKVLDTKFFSALKLSNKNAISELAASSKDILTISEDQALNIFANKILEINSGFIAAKVSKDSAQYNDYIIGVDNLVFAAKVDYLISKTTTLTNYASNNFKNEKFDTINKAARYDKGLVEKLTNLKTDKVPSREKLMEFTSKLILDLEIIEANSRELEVKCGLGGSLVDRVNLGGNLGGSLVPPREFVPLGGSLGGSLVAATDGVVTLGGSLVDKSTLGGSFTISNKIALILKYVTSLNDKLVG